MVVATQGQYAAEFGGALDVGLAENVGAAVYAVALAIPDGEDTVACRLLAVVIQQLGAPDIGCTQIFVDAGFKMDIALSKQLFVPPQGLVVTAQRRTTITGDKAGGVEAGSLVQLLLHQRQAHQGIDSGKKHATIVSGKCRLEGILAVKSQFLIALDHRHRSHLLFCMRCADSAQALLWKRALNRCADT